ncbi:DegT/DnrJ/EryC1/StrS family aminotransferase [Candidatus Wolfebacteria bacterium]|nr:DegT/DnrJ/EryC1/StrS family aminotransferase [Candidatus Wolfebacteria bacterium]
MDSGWISSTGPRVKEFERLFAKFIGSKYALAVSNGSVALDLSLMALNIGAGDEVIVPTFTFAATVNAVIHQGAKPVFVDSSLNDWNIDPEKIEAAITPKTKAIIIAHIYGIPARMKEILKIAKKRNLLIIEDTSEALGALYGNKKAGSLGDIGCFSFFANKVITTGEGGMCVTNNKNIYEKMKSIYSHGSKPNKSIYYYHPIVGYNFRMTSLQAALGVAQLKRIGHFLKIRTAHEKMYRKLLACVSGIEFSPKPDNTHPIYWMHNILIGGTKANRDKLMKELEKYNIETRPFFYPIHKMPPYLKYAKGSFPVAEYLSKTGISLPSSVNLKREEIIYVSGEIKKFFGKNI